MKIDLLVEKYLTSIKKWGHIIDIYTDPTPSELKEIGNDRRFIADAANKKVYVWSAMTALHEDVWGQVIKDSRKLYKSGDIITGEFTGKNTVYIESYFMMHTDIRRMIATQDWSFVKSFDLQGTVDHFAKRDNLDTYNDIILKKGEKFTI